MSYANRIIKLDFPDLSEDPQADPIWVIIRNPRLMPAKEITSSSDSGAYDESGKILDREKAEEGTDALIAKLVIAARVYDASVFPEYDENGNEIPGTGDPVLLPKSRWEPQHAAKLPTEIRVRIAKEFTSAQDPTKTASKESDTSKTSSG